VARGQDGEACDSSVPGRLTPRQAQVLQLLVWDSPAQQIARELGISVRTVEGHLAAMRRHTGCVTLPGLAAWAVATSAAAPPRSTAPLRSPGPEAR
jgi:DNA-binding CsgD family transcriptional regulator